jgi:hypothetical protein
MLEDELGTPKMIEAMSQFVKQHKPRSIGSWGEFEKVVDQVSGMDYTWFFDQWVRRPGVADMTLSDVKWDQGKLSGKLTFRGQPYRMHADLLIRTPNQPDRMSRIDTTEEPDGDGYRFAVDCPDKPSLISIDPWQKLLLKRSLGEAPVSLFSGLRSMREFLDPAHKNDLKSLAFNSPSFAAPEDAAGWFLVGSPETTPAMKTLCDEVGFEVNGNKLSYKGTTIDLDEGGALALVNLPGGKSCVIGLGTSLIRPYAGKAHLLLFDKLGRPIRAASDPVTTGPLAHSF